MASIRTYQQSCNGGELSPEMYGRAGDPKYQSGLAKCRNFLIDPRGPAENRPGFAYVNYAKYADKRVRLIPFTFSTDQSMVLEFGEKYIRFHTDGQTLLGSNGQPYEVATPYSADDLFSLHYVQSADVLTIVHPAYAPRELRRYSAVDWRLVEINFKGALPSPWAPTVVQSINDDVQNKEDYAREYCITALKADGSNESAAGPSTSIRCNPYGTGAYNTISWNAVSGAELYRVYRNQGGIWCFIGQTKTLSIRDEQIDPDASITPPIYDDPFGQSGGITSVKVTNGGSGYGLLRSVSYISQKGRIVGSNGNTVSVNLDAENFHHDDGQGIPYPTITSSQVFYVDGTIEGNGSGGKGRLTYVNNKRTQGMWWDAYLTGVSLTSRGEGYTEGAQFHASLECGSKGARCDYYFPVVLEPASAPNVYVTDATGSGAELEAVVQNGVIVSIVIKKPGSGYTNPVVHIDGSKSGGSGATATATVGKAGDYPSAVTYFEQRRWFGGTYNRPNNIWATKSGTESDMSYSLPSQDDDRIAIRVAAREANRIQHFVPLSQLMLFTAAAEWRVSPLNSDAITPTSMSVRPQSYVGANSVQPLVINNACIYASARGGHLRECGYSYEAGGFVTNDVCLRANHLFDNLEPIDLSYSKAPWPIIWCVSSAGNLIAFTYVPEQSVGAFSSLATDGTFESCAVVPEGEEDVLYVAVRRTINGTTRRFIERMHERKYTKLEESVYLDCCGTYRGDAKDEISGLTWLEGATVSILADGSVEPNQVVKDGKIKLQEPASLVHIGLPYTADLQTLPIALALQDGSFGSGHMKNVQKVSVRLVNTSGLQTGPTFEKLTDYPARGTELAGTPPTPITGEVTTQVNPRWGDGGQICVRQNQPLPMKIVSITTQLEIV